MQRTMPYSRRVGAALVLSLVLHLLFLVLLGHLPQTAPRPITGYKAPLIIELPQAPPEPPVRHVVESPQAADQPVEDTPFISDKPSKAADLQEGGEDGSTPAPDVPSESYQAAEIAAPPLPPTPPLPVRAEPPAPPKKPSTDDQPELLAQLPEARPDPEPPEAAPSPVPAREERPQPLLAPGAGGVQTRGVGAFEAHQDQLAPYLLEVRKAVERYWRAALELRYSGTKPTAAVVDCAIRPDGTLAYVTIVEAGDSVSFGSLCQGAIEKAGPFAPFPFEVPEIYRSKDLEIRWTFRFM